MPFEDKVIVCGDCSQEFTHSAEDQSRYAERGFNDPKRCRDCREKRKTRGKEGGGGGRRPEGDRGGPRGPRREPSESFEAVCAACGVTTTVPFKPTGDRPVYCRDCYRSQRR